MMKCLRHIKEHNSENTDSIFQVCQFIQSPNIIQNDDRHTVGLMTEYKINSTINDAVTFSGKPSDEDGLTHWLCEVSVSLTHSVFNVFSDQ